MHALFSNPIFSRPVVNLCILAVLLVGLFGFSLGERPYSAPSESRYIEIGREMAESGDFVTPRLNYVKYFEKPPLSYWVQALMTKAFGLDPYAGRLATMLFSVALCLLTYALGHLLYGRMEAWLGALVMGTSLYTFALSRIVLTDVPVSVFMVATLYTFLYAVRKPEGRCRTVAIYAMYAAAACAVLTKGLIGAVVPGAVVFLWLLLTKQWKILKTLRLPTGILLFFLIAAPWHILVSLRNPEFPHFYFIHEHFERYFTKVHGRYQPDWFFLVVLVAGLFPWTFFACQGLYAGMKGFWKKRLEDGTGLYLFLWVFFILLFFSLSDSKLIPYILPIFPPITVLIGHYLAEAWREKPAPYFKTGVISIIVLLSVLTIIPALLPRLFDDQSKVMQAVTQAKDTLDILPIITIIAAVGLLVTFIQGQRKHVVIALLAVAVVIIEAGEMVAVHYDKDSMVGIAKVIQSLDKPGDEVSGYDQYYQDLPIYLHRRITVVDWQATELSFGARHEDTSAWMVDNLQFWERWMKNDHRMFTVMRYDVYKDVVKKDDPEKKYHLYFITQVGRNVLFMNQKPDRKE